MTEKKHSDVFVMSLFVLCVDLATLNLYKLRAKPNINGTKPVVEIFYERS